MNEQEIRRRIRILRPDQNCLIEDYAYDLTVNCCIGSAAWQDNLAKLVDIILAPDPYRQPTAHHASVTENVA